MSTFRKVKINYTITLRNITFVVIECRYGRRIKTEDLYITGRYDGKHRFWNMFGTPVKHVLRA